MPSRLTSRAAGYARQAAHAAIAQGRMAAATGASFAVQAAREAARVSSYTDPTDIVSAVDALDGTATITMAAHTRVYPVQGNIDVPDLVFPAPITLLGVALAAHGFVYYIDTTLADVAPTLVFTTIEREAQVGNAPGTHFVGEITTPAGGAGPTGGVGPRPPGSGTQIP